MKKTIMLGLCFVSLVVGIATGYLWRGTHGHQKIKRVQREFHAQLMAAPQDPTNLCIQGAYHEMLGEDRDALACYTRALEVDPDSTAACQALSSFHWTRKHYEQAVQYAERSVATAKKAHLEQLNESMAILAFLRNEAKKNGFQPPPEN